MLCGAAEVLSLSLSLSLCLSLSLSLYPSLRPEVEPAADGRGGGRATFCMRNILGWPGTRLAQDTRISLP